MAPLVLSTDIKFPRRLGSALDEMYDWVHLHQAILIETGIQEDEANMCIQERPIASVLQHGSGRARRVA